MMSKLWLLTAIFAVTKGDDGIGLQQGREMEATLQDMQALVDRAKADSSARQLNANPTVCALDISALVGNILEVGLSIYGTVELCQEAMHVNSEHAPPGTQQWVPGTEHRRLNEHEASGQDMALFCAAEIGHVISFASATAETSLAIIESCVGHISATELCAGEALKLSSAVIGVAATSAGIAGKCLAEEYLETSEASRGYQCSVDIYGSLQQLFAAAVRIMESSHFCAFDAAVCTAQVADLVAALARMSEFITKSLQNCGPRPGLPIDNCGPEYARLTAELAYTVSSATMTSQVCGKEPHYGPDDNGLLPQSLHKARLLDTVDLPAMRANLTAAKRLFKIPPPKFLKDLQPPVPIANDKPLNVAHVAMMFGMSVLIVGLGGIAIGVRLGNSRQRVSVLHTEFDS